MITKQERTKLRSLAQSIKPTVWIGKDNITENVIKQIEEELFSHELIKISMQDNSQALSEYDLTSLAVQVGAEVVTTTGKKIVLYRKSEKKGIKNIL